MKEHFLWSEKYRPKTVNECILPPNIKNTFNGFIADGRMPNLILAGGAGIGKTSVAKAAIAELGADVMFLNGSLNAGIDVLRNDIAGYASAMSPMGGRKYVIFDEADWLTTNVQAALRNFMEEFAMNTSFILTANYKNKIMKELHSRCSMIDFQYDTKTKAKMATQFYKRVTNILDEEKVEADKDVVIEIVRKWFPDARRILNQLQTYSKENGGKIDKGVLVSFSDISLTKLYEDMRQKDFTSVRKWVAENADTYQMDLYLSMYNSIEKHLTPSSIPAVVDIIGEWQYRAAFAQHAEINVAACLSNIMAVAEWR